MYYYYLIIYKIYWLDIIFLHQPIFHIICNPLVVKCLNLKQNVKCRDEKFLIFVILGAEEGGKTDFYPNEWKLWFNVQQDLRMSSMLLWFLSNDLLYLKVNIEKCALLKKEPVSRMYISIPLSCPKVFSSSNAMTKKLI